MSKSLRRAFVLTIAAGAAACGTVTDRGSEGTGPEPASCPPAQPAWGAPCLEDGLGCSYLDACESEVVATCTGSMWDVTAGSPCNPPPPAPCPDTPPPDGAPCPVLGQQCDFGADADGACWTWARCTAEGWEVEYDGGACNPPSAICPGEMPLMGSACEYQPDTFDGYPSSCPFPAQTPCGEVEVFVGCAHESDGVHWRVKWVPACMATPEQCRIYDVDSACEADAGCAWRAPGCEGGAPLVAEGCYPIDDCTVSGCGEWGTCTLASYDPCRNLPCDACAADANLCVPSPAP